MSSFKKNFSGKKVLIWGLGISGGGIGAAKFFSGNGAKVTVTDLKGHSDLKDQVKELGGRNIEFVLGRHRPKDFTAADIIIKNPAVSGDSPYLRLCRMFNKRVETDISIFMSFFRGKMIGVTGTKGKTTTTSLIAAFLEKSKKKFFTAGNIGVSLLDYLDQGKKMALLELSSFNLESLPQVQKSPNIAVFTNIFPDHLNRYNNDLEQYFDVKKNIFRFQKKDDYLVLDYDDPELRKAAKEAPSKVLFFSVKEKRSKAHKDIFTYISGGAIYYKNESLMNVDDIALHGTHNLQNILGAVTVAKLLKIKNKQIVEALKNFGGVGGRCEVLGFVKGVRVVNDTCATNPTSAALAVNSLSPGGKLYLIAGGVDKSLPYSRFAAAVKKNVAFAELLPGSATEKMIKEFTKAGFKNFKINKDIEQAFSGALEKSNEGDTILLSPGAASFNQFKNEFDRGDRFKEIFKKNAKYHNKK
jgi:UDP-N-acetylmuramoylalanine--D-glutamate ligase